MCYIYKYHQLLNGFSNKNLDGTVHKVVETTHKMEETTYKVEELLIYFSVKKVLAYYVDLLPKV